MDEGLVKIILAVITLLGTIITGVIVPYYLSKTTAEKRKEIQAIVKTAVFAVEQLQESGLLKLPKREAVIQYINDKGIKITEADLEMFLEAAVKELNLEQDYLKILSFS